MSGPLSQLPVVSEAGEFYLYLPAAVGWGETRVIVRVPSQGVFWADLGGQLLSELEPGVFNRISVPLSTELRAALLGSYDDLDVHIVINGPSLNEPYLLDGLNFAGSGTPSSPFHMVLPDGLLPQQVALSARNILKVNDRASVLHWRDGAARIVNTGDGGGTPRTELGVSARTGSVWSAGDVFLRELALLDGDLTALGDLVPPPQNNANVTGAIQTYQAFPTWNQTWEPTLPSQTSGSASLEPGHSRELQPGGYTTGDIKQDAVLMLSAGIYLFDDLTLNTGSELRIDDTDGPVQIYTRGCFTFRGAVLDAAGESVDEVDLLVTVMGACTVPLEAPFVGTVHARESSIILATVAQPGHIGSFFGRDVELHQDTQVTHRAFPWDAVLPRQNRSWSPSPVELTSRNEPDSGASAQTTAQLPEPIPFRIPEYLHVDTGNAGMGVAVFEFEDSDGVIVACTYRGAAQVAHPTSDFDRMLGLRYRLESCSNGAAGNSEASGSWFSLDVQSGDDQDPAGATQVAVHVGDGCSGVIEAPISPVEVVAMRDGFAWTSTSGLAESDPDGNPALWHGLIYIERKEQLETLDRLRILYSPTPLSSGYRQTLEGRCGRVEHATDGRGVVVYAVFPARFYNMIRDFGEQAEAAGVEPPFKFVIPSTPDEPEFTHPDGSLRYSALASTGYLDWLRQGNEAQPFLGVLVDVVEWVGNAVVDAAEWLADDGVDALETGIDYVAIGYDAAIDAITIGLDDVWEHVQMGLQDLFEIGGVVTATVNVSVQNLDPGFAPGPLERAWGPRVADAGGAMVRPTIVPTGARVRIRQWGWGLLPLMGEAPLPEDGTVRIPVAQAQSGQSHDELCIELDTDYAMMTTDLIPNEVCDFRRGGPSLFGGFETDASLDLAVAHDDVFGLTQLKDGSDYAKTVIGHEPYKSDVLIGRLANNITSTIAGGHRAMALCLDYPSTGVLALQSALILASDLGMMAGNEGAAVTGNPLASVAGTTAAVGSVVGFFSLPAIQKDLWWPDGSHERSRGVMTHEYGHLAMCSMIFDIEGANGLTGLMTRLFDGEDSRDDDVALMLETIADTYASQVVGGSNYVNLNDAQSSLGMSYCIASPCLDQNLIGVGDFVNAITRPNDPAVDFRDEHARWESLVYDAFDRADSTSRESNNVGNADYWQPAAAGALEFGSAGFIANADEPVSLPGAAWRTWIERWLQRGTVPSAQNVLGGLADAIVAHGATWCDACEVFAIHDPSVATLTGGAFGPPATPVAPTQLERFERWELCRDTGAINRFTGAPPEPFGNLDASCEACPPLFRADAVAGGCVACGLNEVPRGQTCVACAPGEVAAPNNRCERCADDEIAINGGCVSCPPGSIADEAGTTCLPCPMDATLDWSTLPETVCEQQAHFAIDPALIDPTDICPHHFWVEITGLDDLSTLAEGVQATTFLDTELEGLPCVAGRSETSIFGPGPNDAWQELAGDETEGEYVPCDDGPYICPETCKLDTQAFVPTNALTEPLRVHASLSSTIPVEATLSVQALAEGVDCSHVR